MSFQIKKDSKLKSGVYLVAVQVCLFVVPLVASPYIISRVGIERYGAFIFFITATGLVSTVISYGFVQTGVRDIAQCKSLKEVEREYSLIFYSKLFLLLVAGLFCAALLGLESFAREKELFIYSLLYLPVFWLDTSFVYQGIERLKDYVLANLAGNVFYVMALFVFIRRVEDYVYLPLVFALPRIAALFFSILGLYYRFGIAPRHFSPSGIAERLKSGFRFFSFNVFVIIYTRAPIIALGLLTNNAYVGYYGIADQLAGAFSSIQGKVSTVFHPQIAASIRDSLSAGVSKAVENIQAILITSTAAILFVQFFAYDLLYILFRENAAESATVLRVLSLNLLTMHLSSILGVQLLVSMNRETEVLRSSMFGAILALTAGMFLVYYMRHVGAAVTIAAIEGFILLYIVRAMKKTGIAIPKCGLNRKTLEYIGVMLGVIVLLRLGYGFLDAGLALKLAAVSAAYALSAALALKALKMVDFRERRLIVS